MSDSSILYRMPEKWYEEIQPSWINPVCQLPPKFAEVLVVAVYYQLPRRLIAIRDEDGAWRCGDKFQDAIDVMWWQALPEMPINN